MTIRGICFFLSAALVSGGIPSLCRASEDVVAADIVDYPTGGVSRADSGLGWNGGWRVSRTAQPSVIPFSDSSSGSSGRRAFLIRGTGGRNNPLRRELAEPFSQPELFLSFDLHYRAPSELPESGVDPEFFVVWLDRLAGGDGSTHAANVPNIGIHLADRGPKKGRNVFMVRIGPAKVGWSRVEPEYGRTYRVVGRLTKSRAGARADYDRFELWVDPESSDADRPDAVVSDAQSISLIQWIGVSTGVKTEASDEVLLSNLVLARSWESVLGSVPTQMAAQRPRGFRGIVRETPVDFASEVYPLLKSRCFDCHAGDNPDSGYRLDVHRELMGYSHGEILAEPGRSHQSRLIEVVAAESPEDRMPPEGYDRLTAEETAMLAAWIDQGMKWDDRLLPAPKRKSDHWAFQPVIRPEVPEVTEADWVRTPVDAFIAAAHESAGLEHAGEASSVTLIRRLYLDLLGLPPTPEELDVAMADIADGGWDRLTDRVLQSPHYGERWARYWLDLARWAESQGYQHDIVRPYAWRYRDYVIDAFNSDKPYDRFLKEQLAGDELQPYSDENLIATGFLGAARISGNQEDEAIQRNDVLVDIVNATGSAVLGLTMECAQCHNHKFDPISQRDYYRLQAFFVRGQLGNLSLRDPDAASPNDLEEWIPEAALAFYRKEVKTLVRKKLFKAPTKPYTWGFLSADTGDPGIERLPVVNRKPIRWQPAVLRETRARMLIRGDTGSPGQEVSPGWPEVLGEASSDPAAGTRTALADWMADPANPLVSRVWVNRLWQYHFGRGIVATSGDFGVEGAEPTHPELLDWLASELIESGWSTRHIHRLIVRSSVYRQQRRFHAENAGRDPQNRLLWNWTGRRLEAEAIRDSVLTATGELDRTIGGISVPPEREEEQLRRTIYLFQQRSSMPSVMEMFDAPEGIASCSRRAVSTVALQPLFMLNSGFMARRAEALASVVREEAGDDPRQQVNIAFRRTLGRLPDDEEAALAVEILRPDPEEPHEDARLMQFCHAMLNLNEFVYVP